MFNFYQVFTMFKTIQMVKIKAKTCIVTLHFNFRLCILAYDIWHKNISIAGINFLYKTCKKIF